MAFSNIENSEKLKIIDIAIIENDEFSNNKVFNETFKTLSDENNKDRLFNIRYVTEEKAKEMLEKDEVIGYLELKDNPKITIKVNGINQTIFKQVTEEINQNQKIIKSIVESKASEYMENMSQQNIGNINEIYEKIYEEVAKIVNENRENIKNISSDNLSYTMIEFYTLIAMTCLYGGTLGMTAINQKLPNMSSIGKRVGVSPVKKGEIILSSSLASYIIQLIGLCFLFVYTIFVLKIDYGDNLRIYNITCFSTVLLQDLCWEYAFQV